MVVGAVRWHIYWFTSVLKKFIVIVMVGKTGPQTHKAIPNGFSLTENNFKKKKKSNLIVFVSISLGPKSVLISLSLKFHHPKDTLPDFRDFSIPIVSYEFHGQSSLVSYSPYGCKESDTTEAT